MLKASILVWIGLDRDALVILVSLPLCLLAAGVTRRPLASPLPWLLVLALGLGNEATGLWLDGQIGGRELWPAGRDLLLFMAVPTVLMLVGRFRPQLIAARADRRILVPTMWEKRASGVEAVFREREGGAGSQARTG